MTWRHGKLSHPEALLCAVSNGVSESSPHLAKKPEKPTSMQLRAVPAEMHPGHLARSLCTASARAGERGREREGEGGRGREREGERDERDRQGEREKRPHAAVSAEGNF